MVSWQLFNTLSRCLYKALDFTYIPSKDVNVPVLMMNSNKKKVQFGMRALVHAGAIINRVPEAVVDNGREIINRKYCLHKFLEVLSLHFVNELVTEQIDCKSIIFFPNLILRSIWGRAWLTKRISCCQVQMSWNTILQNIFCELIAKKRRKFPLETQE